MATQKWKDLMEEKETETFPNCEKVKMLELSSPSLTNEACGKKDTVDSDVIDSTKKDSDVIDSTAEVDDPYLYTKMKDFTSEIYKIEINNLPNYFGHGQIRKLLNGKLKLDTHKIKAIGNPPRFVFVTFKNEVARDNALKCLDGYKWKGKDLRVKKTNPMADPMVKKRKAGDSEDAIAAKKQKSDDQIPVPEMLRNVVTPWWNKSYEEQLSMKEDIIKKFLIRLGKELQKSNPSLNELMQLNRKKYDLCCDLKPIKPSPLTSAYRNKCEFSIGRDLYTKEKTVGFRLSSYKAGSMSVADPDVCVNVSEAMLRAAASFKKYIQSSDKDVYNPETHGGYWRQLTLRTSRNGDLLLIVIIHPQILSQEEIEREKLQVKDYFERGPGIECGVTSLYFQLFDKRHANEENNTKPEHLLGKSFIEESLLDMTFQISPEAFFQINVSAAEVLFKNVSDVVGNKSGLTILDICCGTGTIGLYLAKEGAKVIGIEMCREAVTDAETNAKVNNITSAKFLCGKAEDVITSAVYENKDSEVVAIADPPRAGLHSRVLKAIRASDNIKKLIYVSCNPNTAFANFVSLCRPTSNNYRGLPFYPVQVLPVDMFPHTPHYELILVFMRQDIAAQYVRSSDK